MLSNYDPNEFVQLDEFTTNSPNTARASQEQSAVKEAPRQQQMTDIAVVIPNQSNNSADCNCSGPGCAQPCCCYIYVPPSSGPNSDPCNGCGNLGGCDCNINSSGNGDGAAIVCCIIAGITIGVAAAVSLGYLVYTANRLVRSYQEDTPEEFSLKAGLVAITMLAAYFTFLIPSEKIGAVFEKAGSTTVEAVDITFRVWFTALGGALGALAGKYLKCGNPHATQSNYGSNRNAMFTHQVEGQPSNPLSPVSVVPSAPYVALAPSAVQN